MTRLTQNDIQDIPAALAAYDDTLMGLTGADLCGTACRAYGLAESAFRDAAARTRVGVVPITWGLGIIPGFGETIQAIAAHLGFTAFVTHETNVAGFSAAAQRNADMILLSDDNDFLAIHLKTGISAHNSAATGKVFAAGLDMMAGGLAGQEVLVVGCGPVGRQAGHELLLRGARLAMADLDLEKAHSAAQALRRQLAQAVSVVADIQEALQAYRFILDASPAANILDARHVTGNTLISAPGVPLGLTQKAMQAAAGRLLHDTLQLGVAAMLVAVVKGLTTRK